MKSQRLPSGIDALTGASADKLENTRRNILDAFREHGYQFVIPPMIESLEADTIYGAHERAFKFIDPQSGNLVAIRSDTTPQIARIDLQFPQTERRRYCYINTTLVTKADDFHSSRSLMQTGAELFGADDAQADIEIINLLIKTLDIIGINDIVLSLGNVSIFGMLIREFEIPKLQEHDLRRIYATRSRSDLEVYLEQHSIKGVDRFKALLNLEGREGVLEQARKIFDNPELESAITRLEHITKIFNSKVEVIIDLADLGCNKYHQGIVFSAYNKNLAKPLAVGGRYWMARERNVLERSATGFSFDLKYFCQSS